MYRLKTTDICYLTVTLVQEFRSILTGWFRLRISQEVAVKMSAGAAVIWKLYGPEDLLPSSFMWFRQEASMSCHVGLSIEGPHYIAADFHQEHGNLREKLTGMLESLLWPNLESCTSLLLPYGSHTDQLWNNVRGNYTGCKYQDQGSLGCHGGCLLQTVIPALTQSTFYQQFADF